MKTDARMQEWGRVPQPEPPPSFLQLPPAVTNLLSIFLFLAAIVTVLSFIAVGLLWWVEYRGLDRLSPSLTGSR